MLNKTDTVKELISILDQWIVQLGRDVTIGELRDQFQTYKSMLGSEN